MGKLKIGVALWSFGPHETDEEFFDKLDTAVSVGVKAVQIWAVDYGPTQPCSMDPFRCTGAKRREMRRACESRGLAISGLCAQLFGESEFGGLGEESGLDDRIRVTKACIDLAVDLEAPVVTTHVGEIPPDRDSPRYRTFLRSCGEIARHAASRGAAFALETGQETAEALKRFIEDLDTPGAKVNFDPCNLHWDGTVKGVHVLAPYIVHAHAKDHNPTTGKATTGQGHVPWAEYLAAMDAIGYTGWHALEDETGAEVVDSIRAGREFLERF